MFKCFAGDNEQALVSRGIEKELESEREKNKSKYRVLLLGAAESGKSTFIKQTKIIYLSGFTESEIAYYVQNIRQNVRNALAAIRKGSEKLGIPFSNASMEMAITEVLDKVNFINESGLIPPDTPSVREFFKSLLQDEGVKAIIKRGTEIDLYESGEYFLSNYSRICEKNYHPTDQDVLFARACTTGIQETTFTVGGRDLTYVDVGGQRSERRKWVHQFESMNAILFVASLSEYDQRLVEDEEVWRTKESLDLFDKVMQSRWFISTPVILFLNKTDIFKRKITEVPLKNYFPEYDGGDEYEKGLKFFRHMYKAKIGNSKKDFYIHYTCATDISACKFVFSAINNIIIKKGVKSVGLV